MKIRIFPLSAYQANCYLVSRENEAIIIDPGDLSQELVNIIEKEKLKITHILITHIHLDHFYAASKFAELTGAQVYISPDDGHLIQEEIDTWEECMYSESCGRVEYEPFLAGQHEYLGEKCEVLSTPGHTPGSLTLHFPDSNVAFVGDVIFAGSVGRTDFNGGDTETLMHTVKNIIFKLPSQTKLYSGHGPATTVGHEEKHNPFAR